MVKIEKTAKRIINKAIHLRRVLDDGSVEFEIINIGSGESYSVAELIQIVQTICGTKLPVISSGEKRQAEIMNTIADISKAKELLHWSPVTSMFDGIHAIIQQYKQAKS